MRTVNFYCAVAAATTVSWKADKDYMLVGLTGSGNGWLSTDPAATITNRITSPPQTVATLGDIELNANYTYAMSQLNFLVSKDTTLYCAVSGKGVITALLEDVFPS